MDPLRSERIKSVFLRAAELAGPQREAVIAAECAGDPEMRKRVEELLAGHDETGSMEVLPHAPALAPGRLLSGRFRIVRLLGKGGMGEVYEAADEELRGRVALKTILPGLIENEQVLARFRREVQLARQVTHGNVCRIFDVGRDRAGGEELHYLTMELMDGETLAALLQREKRLTPEAAEPLLRQVAAGVAALHEKRIVHRDLKPGNVMIVGTRAVVTDFGLARAVLEESLEEGLSHSGLVLGTPGYMAPEQLAGKPVSAATDVYALGVLAYEMVTGTRAFPPSRGKGPPAAPRSIAKELPAAWERAILRCLEPEAAARPGSVAEAMALFDEAPEEVAVSRRWLWPAAAVVVGLGLWAWGRTDAVRSPAAYAAEGSRQFQEGKFAEAREAFAKELALAPRAEAYSHMGSVLRMEGRFDEAVAMYLKALEQRPESYAIWGDLGAAYLWSTADKAKAAEAFRKAIALAEGAPTDAGATAQLGEYYARLGEEKKSLPLLQRATVSDAESPEALYRVGTAYELLGKREEALRWIGRAMELGYAAEFVKRSPELAGLRKDPRFAAPK